MTGLPAQTARSVRESAVAGIAVAHKLGSPSLLDSVQGSLLHGMDVMLWVCAAGGLLGTVLAFAYLPARARKTSERPGCKSELSHEPTG